MDQKISPPEGRLEGKNANNWSGLAWEGMGKSLVKVQAPAINTKGKKKNVQKECSPNKRAQEVWFMYRGAGAGEAAKTHPKKPALTTGGDILQRGKRVPTTGEEAKRVGRQAGRVKGLHRGNDLGLPKTGQLTRKRRTCWGDRPVIGALRRQD